jgi:hypothetical protein
LLTAGCQAPACPLPGQNRADSLKLYFGRDIPGGGFVTDQAWSAFAASVLTPAFPDGFTAYEALGQWRNPQDGKVVRERSFVVESVGPVSPPQIKGVIDTYRTRFRQISVGQVTTEVCAAF